MKAFLAGVLATAMPAMVQDANAKDVELKLGRFDPGNGYAQQLVIVRNNASKTFKNVTVECGFFKDEELIGVGYGYITNIKPNGEGFGGVVASTASTKADRVSCRVSDIYPPK